MPTTHTHLIFWLPAGFHYNETGRRRRVRERRCGRTSRTSAGRRSSTRRPSTRATTGRRPTRRPTSTRSSTRRRSRTPGRWPTRSRRATSTTEVFNQINANGWPLGLSDMYFVFLPDNLVDCDNGAGANCNTNAYCAYHTRGWSGSDTPANDFIWADIPVNRGVVHDRRLRQLERDGRQPGRHDAQLRRARAPGGDHRSARERLAGLDRRRRRERRQVQPQHGRRQRVLDDRRTTSSAAAAETSSASSASGRTRQRSAPAGEGLRGELHDDGLARGGADPDRRRRHRVGHRGDDPRQQRGRAPLPRLVPQPERTRTTRSRSPTRASYADRRHRAPARPASATSRRTRRRTATSPRP